MPTATATEKPTRATQATTTNRRAFDDPRYIEARDRYDRLMSRKAEVERELARIQERSLENLAPEKRNAIVNAIYYDTPLPGPREVPKEVRDLQIELQATEEAIQIARDKMNRACADVSEEIIAREKPGQIARTRAIFRAAGQLLALLREEQTIARDMSDGGTVLHLYPREFPINLDELEGRITGKADWLRMAYLFDPTAE
jgi:hypothetical protein